jgi:glucose/mannose transport system permease protein
VLSVTASRMLPNYETFVGLEQYAKLWEMDRWWLALKNLGVFSVLYVGGSMLIGMALAIVLDQKVRAEGLLRTIYLYPMALSFIVTGTAWKWMLNPSLGLEKLMHDLGWQSFTFDWLVQGDTAIYCVVIAGIWQSAGFAMALFLAGLRGIDDSIIKAAQMDGASLPRIYWRVILPILRPVVFSTVMVLSHLSIKSFDLVMALTGGGPWLCVGRARHLHVRDELHPWPDRSGRGQRHHDAGHRGSYRRALPLQRTAEQTP